MLPLSSSTAVSRRASPFKGVAAAMRKIVTSYVNPPIPYRQNEWCAHYDGEEEAGSYGWGATEADAIRDFIENCQEDHDERLGDRK
jgi:hypothetical protein